MAGHIQWWPAPSILGLEYRQIATSYSPASESRPRIT
jgi:hypothetical protein